MRVVADDAEVQLHHHTEAVVLPPQLQQQRRLELLLLVLSRDLAREALLENGFDSLCRRRRVRHALQAVVGDAAAAIEDGPFDLFWYCVKLAASCRQIKTQRSGFDLERKKEPADVQFSRLFRKPRKWNGAGFF